MDLYGPNEMTSTHSGNPLCCAAALASINIILNENLVKNAKQLGKILNSRLQKMRQKHSDYIGFAPCQGLVAGLLMVKPGSKEPNYDIAWKVIYRCFQKGILIPAKGSFFLPGR